MKLLGIDTTSKLASVIVTNNNNVFYESDTNEITHSEKLLPLIDKVLKKSGLQFKDIELLATTNGPGSFTGCRIGVATIKALSLPTNLDIFAVTSLELMAFQAFLSLNVKEARICSILDAKNHRIYYSAYYIVKTNEKLVVTDLCEVTNEDLSEALENLSSLHNLTFIGDCITKFNQEIEDYGIKHKLSFNLLNKDIIPEAKYLAEYYSNLYNYQNKMYNTFNLDVVYARVSQAERYKNEHR